MKVPQVLRLDLSNRFRFDIRQKIMSTMNNQKSLLSYISCTIFILLFVFNLNAQSDNWKKNLKTADKLFGEAQYASAAEYYMAAWKQKPKKLELAFKAGEAFYIIKDYAKAADAFKNVKEEYSDYPLIGLKYARALKQSGDYDSASRELVYFLNNYKGADKDIISELVQNEIRGCELGIKMNAFPDEDVEIQHLSSNINTPETEFAPFAFNDETLYYSSTMAARAEIYRSLKVNGEWTKPEKPGGFPDIENDHFCNGNLAPDNKRFYFTICKSKESWGGLTTECDLFVIKNQDGKWGNPERLRDYVNIEGSTSTHPYVVHQDNTELLYFASNREGGKGGMDIWYMTRDLRSDDIDFTFPINCGSKINTKGDEISPYYDQEGASLYFSSNGLVTIGGYDIFQASGNKSAWETPENIGTPLNSSADDFFFVRTPSRQGGFFASNRMFGAEKIATTDEDIFSFTDGDSAPKVSVKGNVVDEKNNENLNGVMVSISQYMEGGRKQFLSNKRFDDGNYFFEVLPGAEYELEAQKEGFLPKTYVFSTREEGMRTAGKTIKMERVWDGEGEMSSAITPTTQTSTPQAEKPRTNISPKRDEPAMPKTETSSPKVTIIENSSAETAMEAKVDTPTVSTPEVETYENTRTTITETTGSARTETPSTSTPNTDTYVQTNTNSTSTYNPPVTTRPTSRPSSGNGSTKVKLRDDYNPNNKVTINTSGVTTNRTTYVSGEGTPVSSNGVTSSAPRHTGTYYKVQLIAVTRHDPSATRYNSVRGMGRMDTELIEAKNVTRVLLADYFSYDEAKKALGKVRQKQAFTRAFLVKYKDGERVGRVN